MAGLMDKLKGAAGVAKDKVDVMVDKAGTKVPPKVKHTYDKVSEKAEKVIPGNRNKDGVDAVADDTVDADVDTVDAAAPVEAQDAVEDAATEAAEKAEGTADA